ncbi:MAG TPA: hypothetical protein VIY08_07055 [Candidatus Nitrosocosmicus sp.]
MQKINSSFEHRIKDDASINEVTKLILKIISSENPVIKYFVGKDMEKWLKDKKVCWSEIL